jgi:ATP-dependent DNA ligase
MPRVVKRSASQAVKAGSSRRSRSNSTLPLFVPPQLSQPVEKPPSGPQWVHEIKLDGYRMAARIENGRAQLLTRTGLDWTDKYPSAAAALANLNVKTAYIDGELCGVDDAGLPSFAQTQAATERRARGASRLLRFRSLAHWRMGRLGLVANRAQGAARAVGFEQARPSVQWA